VVRVPPPARTAIALCCCAAAALCGCGAGSSTNSAYTRPLAQPPGTSSHAAAGQLAGELTAWPEFGLDPQRADATSRPTGITAANVRELRDRRIALPGVVDSSPIYVHAVSVAGASRDVIVVTTSYGRTLALDADSGDLLWTFTPPGYSSWAGGAQVTNASPIADPRGGFVYAASPDGLIHKLSLANGREDRSGAWPVRVTRDATREKLGSALNVDGPDVIATTSGYLGDTPTYQGHVVLISRASGAVEGVFNTLCANRRAIIRPSECAQSDSAILSRAGAVVEPGGARLLLDTGNGPWNGSSDFGDSAIELTFPALKLRQAFTPADQAHLNASDLDLGSSAPALLGDRVLVAGKDGVMRVLDRERLDGGAPFSRERLGGEVQTLSTPGDAEPFAAPAVWRHGSAITVFVADSSGTGAYALRGGRLTPLWVDSTPGTSPILAGGLLYVYDPSAGGIDVYRPASPRPIAHLQGAPGHWNSPIVVDGHVVEPEGDANAHTQSGTLDLFTAP
jgi:hypothetical protein